MAASEHSLLGRFLVWRSKNISTNNFILILSVIIGIASGFAALILKTSVFYIHKLLLEDITFHHDTILFFFLPAVGILLTVLFKKYFLNDAIKHNVSTILHAISSRQSLMRAHKIFSSILGGILTAGFGGSIGLESPIISSSSSIGSNLAKKFRLDYKTVTLLLACGAAAGISAIFNTPIAGIIFALEVLMIDMSRFSLIPLLMSSACGTMVTHIFLEKKILFEITRIGTFDFADIPLFILLGVLLGGFSVYFTKIFLAVENRFNKLESIYKRFAIGALILGALIYFLPPLYGEGYNSITLFLNGNIQELMSKSIFEGYANNFYIVVLFLVALIALKVIATATTIGSGGIGGIFAPSVFTGAVIGFLFAYTYNYFVDGADLSISVFILIGMAGMVSGVLHAPLTSIFLIAELTSGYELIVPLMLTAIIAFVSVKYFEPNSIFTMHLAKEGKLITHHKDKAVLKFMRLTSVIETDLKIVNISASLGELVKIISKSSRNIFPVCNDEGELLGIIHIEQIRHIMFNNEMYETSFVKDLMVSPGAIIYSEDSMEEVIKKFNDTNAWNLPVVENNKYKGFVSKSKLFSEYRKLLVDITSD